MKQLDHHSENDTVGSIKSYIHTIVNHDLTFKFYLNLPIVYFAMSVNRTVTATPNN